MDVKKKGFESETSAFNVKSHISREPGRENRGTLLFPRVGVQPAENLSGFVPMNKCSQSVRSLPRKTFIKEPSPGSARIPPSPSRIPKDTNRCAGGEIIMHGLFTLQAQLCFDFGVLALTIYLPGRSRRRPQINSKTTLNEEQQLLFGDVWIVLILHHVAMW